MPDYRIIGAYDSETSNIKDGILRRAYPVLHILGIMRGYPELSSITPDNVENALQVTMYRHTCEVTRLFDLMAAHDFGFVPVIAVHNLGFDMYPLASWLDTKRVRVLAKSARKPITFTILDDEDAPRLILWDTAVFSQKPLSMMGAECGYVKGVGEWDYSLTRTPETPLTDLEIDYAKRDVCALIAWLGHWCRLNPDMPADMLGRGIVTKTGVVRTKRRLRFSNRRGRGHRASMGRYWEYMNKSELPKTDAGLFTMHACTRGGFTFCASRWASVPIVCDSFSTVAAFDATSQHPAHMVSHRYPVQFHDTAPENLTRAFQIVAAKTPDHVLAHFVKPFPIAFLACFEIDNIRPKADSIFAREGIYPLASARFSGYAPDPDADNGDAELFKEHIAKAGYKDQADGGVFQFGKLKSAKRVRVWLTELEAWIIGQCYDYDSVRAISGYMTTRFVRPSDMSVVSVMQFYKAKGAFKSAMREYAKTNTISSYDELISLGFPQYIVAGMRDGQASADDMALVYQSAKADLNGLYGIECTNEARKDTVLTSDGIAYEGIEGVHNLPEKPKAWYQFGQRIVGWSRIAQVLCMQLVAPYVRGIINGDTDSLKLFIDKDRMPDIEHALSRYAQAVDAAKTDTCARVSALYPQYFDSLDNIGYYVLEGVTGNFCASWNKAYCSMDAGEFSFTLAGVPSKELARIAQKRYLSGETFESICTDLLGYNIAIAPDVTGLNQRVAPVWGSYFYDVVTDYLGNVSQVCEPAALGLFPMAKTINDTAVKENAENFKVACVNNPALFDDRRILTQNGMEYLEGMA